MKVLISILIFLPICFITSLVCTALKMEEHELHRPKPGSENSIPDSDEDDAHLWKDTIKFFVMLTIGITLFCLLIYIVTVIAGSEFSAVW